VVISLERGANGLLMSLLPRHLLLHPEWFTFLLPAYPGPGKKAIKRM